MLPDRPILSLEELEAFDPHAPQGVRRRFCCPLCGQSKPKDSAHRCLSVESASGPWKCFRCEASGRLCNEQVAVALEWTASTGSAPCYSLLQRSECPHRSRRAQT